MRQVRACRLRDVQQPCMRDRQSLVRTYGWATSVRDRRERHAPVAHKSHKHKLRPSQNNTLPKQQPPLQAPPPPLFSNYYHYYSQIAFLINEI